MCKFQVFFEIICNGRELHALIGLLDANGIVLTLFNPRNVGTFTDVCGDLTGNWTEAFGCDVELSGTVNNDGTLSIRWDNCFGDFADAVYTKQ